MESSPGSIIIVTRERCYMDRGGDRIRPFPSGSVRRCVRTQAARVRSLLFRTFRPSWTSVICLEKLRDLSLGHATRSAFVKSFCEPSITFLPRCRSGRITAPRRTHHEKVVYPDRPPPPPEDVLWAPWARSIRRAQAPRLPLFMPLSVGLSRRCRRCFPELY